MKARKQIDGASYAPEVVHALGEAFEQAWKEIAGNFGHDPNRIDAARMRLADAVLSVASETSTDVEALKTGALEAMAGVYRSPVRSPPKPDMPLRTR
jgi:hypothetical protein